MSVDRSLQNYFSFCVLLRQTGSPAWLTMLSTLAAEDSGPASAAAKRVVNAK
jgi:hypothetical protein